MKILLIQPPMVIYPFETHSVPFPLGLAYMAAVLENEGYTVEILDCILENWNKPAKEDGKEYYGLSYKDIDREIRKRRPDIVGISCLFSSQWKHMKEIAKIAKKYDCKVVVGGAHPSSEVMSTIKNRNIDFVIIGEGEYTMLNIVKSIENAYNFRKIDGIAFRSNRKVVINPKTKFIENLDELPFPAYHLLSMKKYFQAKRPHGTEVVKPPSIAMITSRGCPRNCVFCSIHTIWGWRWRARSPEKVVDEIEFLVKNYGANEINFEDDNISLDKERMERICDEIIKRKLKIKWTTPNGIAIMTLDKKLLYKMKKSGC
jgi:anaerobic magnesium-protoporphyrin IX monomethyl ester cyclase